MNCRALSGVSEDVIKNTREASISFDSVNLYGAKYDRLFEIPTKAIEEASAITAMVPGGLFKRTKPVQAAQLLYRPAGGDVVSVVLVPDKPSDLPGFLSGVNSEIEHLKDIRERGQNFANLLASIPRASVGLDGVKGKVRSSVEFINGLKLSSITAKSAYSMLGDFVSIDIETCGLAVTDPVLEVAAIRFSAYDPDEVFESYIDPKKPIPEEATRINHITDDMVAGAPTIWQIIPSLYEFVGALPIVGHNIPFDLKFLYRYGFDLKPKQKVYDTLPLSRKAFKDSVDNYSLETILHKCGVYPPSLHSASTDALSVGILYRGIAEELASNL